VTLSSIGVLVCAAQGDEREPVLPLIRGEE